MEAEIQNQHSEKWKLRKEIRKMRTTLKKGLNLIILNTVFHQLNVVLKSKFKVVTSDIKRNHLIYANKKH